MPLTPHQIVDFGKKKKSWSEVDEISNFRGRLLHARYEALPQHFVYVPSVAEHVVNCGLITAGVHSCCCRSESRKRKVRFYHSGEGKLTVTSGFSLLFWTCKLSLKWTDVQDWLSLSCNFALTSNFCLSEQRKEYSYWTKNCECDTHLKMV